jgi:hypothetical protein
MRRRNARVKLSETMASEPLRLNMQLICNHSTRNGAVEHVYPEVRTIVSGFFQ